MQNEVLLAVDGSERCRGAIASLGCLLKSRPNCAIVLYHCVQKLGIDYLSSLAGSVHTYHVPAELQRKVGENILEDSRRVLLDSGFSGDAVRMRLKLNSDDPAEDIIVTAKEMGIDTIALGRRGLSRMESLLIGSVSDRVAQYSGPLNVWIVDTPLHSFPKALVAIQGLTGGRVLNRYASQVVSMLGYPQCTFLHLVPPMPSMYLMEGPDRVLTRKDNRENRSETAYRKEFLDLMSEGRDALVQQGLTPENIQMRVEPTKEGIARDLLGEINREEYQVVIIGKKSLQKKTPFLLGSLANKLLHNAKGVILCMVGS